MSNFASKIVTGLIVMGAMGIIGGVVLICVMHDTLAGAACLSIGSSVVSGLIGVLVAPALNPQLVATSPALPPDVANFATALGNAVNTLKSP
jgi:hypothetical protein